MPAQNGAFAEQGDSAPIDLSVQVVQCIEREPGERVTCRRVSGNNYRCNWWAPETTAKYDNPSMVGLLVTTHRVRRSRFLNVTKTAQGLVIEDGSMAAGRRG